MNNLREEVINRFLNRLTPMASQHDDRLFRVPMRRIDGDYILFVADFSRRIFTDDTLPNFIKHKIAMILASPTTYIWQDDELIKTWNLLSVYTNTYQPNLEDVGWRISDTMFVIIMSYENLMSLRSERLTEDSV
jgi:hypothetical protein